MVPINSTLLISVHKKRHRNKRQDNLGSFSEDLYPDCLESSRDKFLPRILVLLSVRGSSRPLCETTSSSWTSNEEISSYVLQSGNPCWIGSLCPFFDFSKWTRSLPIRWFMVQFELPGRRMEHTIFRMSSKETANELWGQGFCARVLGVQQRVLSTWEDDTGVSTPCGRLSWLLFPNFSQRFSILSYNQKMLLRWVVSYLEHEPRRPHSPQDTCWLSMTTIGPRGYWCPYTNH